MLSVCVCGWYLEQYDELYRTLFKLNQFNDTPVFVVANRESTFLDDMGLPYAVRENRGLEFGAYDHYLKHVWDGKSDVLFMHDDVVVGPRLREYQILPPEMAWDAFRDPEYDQAYIFRDRSEDVVNDGKHGRMIYCSARLLDFHQEKGGIPFDETNLGYTSGLRPDGVKPYNYGVMHFDFLLDEARSRGMRVRERVYLPWFQAAHRGTAGTMTLEQGRITVQSS